MNNILTYTFSAAALVLFRDARHNKKSCLTSLLL